MLKGLIPQFQRLTNYGLTSYSSTWSGRETLWFLNREGSNFLTNRISAILRVNKMFIILELFVAFILKITEVLEHSITILLFLTITQSGIALIYTKHLKNKNQVYRIKLGLRASGGLEKMRCNVLNSLNETDFKIIEEIFEIKNLDANDYKQMANLVDKTQNYTIAELIAMYRKLNF